jgi:hypothetical protein
MFEVMSLFVGTGLVYGVMTEVVVPLFHYGADAVQSIL